MPGERREIERRLNELPESFTAGQIQQMYKDLVVDVNILTKQKVPLANIEAQLHKKHRVLAYSYPTLFFRVVRGEMDEHIFNTLMCLKKKVDDGEITNETAKERVIDGAKRQVQGLDPKMKRTKTEGGIVQEINMKCRVEDGLNQIN